MSTIDRDLDPVLEHGDPDDLAVLADYITDNGAGRLSLDSDVCKTLHGARVDRDFGDVERSLIAKEIRLFGGNSIINLFRGDGVPYAEVLRDVASHIGVGFSKTTVASEIEERLLRHLLGRALEKMSESERTAILTDLEMEALVGKKPAAMALALTGWELRGPATYKLAVIMANALARTLAGRGLVFGANAALGRTLGIALGPIGWAVTGLWSIADLASPAYRVTVPCVVQLAYMRQKMKISKNCPSCRQPVESSAKFCPNCGHKLKK
ncbi:ubiquinol-cytochrome C chaperone family protein [Paraburkholderia sp. A1BS-2L]|uniref:zinc ribbon domain-containing protein n=1 Tax=Paraburkholderia sp. A1BS-2L TaxID=3028373 RepID=UPI003DA81002